MMATAVEMPKLGNTVEECVITAWRKHPGDQVAAGDVIAEVETDKASFDITAADSGTLLETFFAEGDLVPVFTTLCVLGTVGENIDQFRPGNAPGAVGAADAGPAGPAEVAEVAGASGGGAVGATPTATGAGAGAGTPGVTGAGGPVSPRARRYATEHDLDPRSVAGSGPGGRVIEADLREARHSTQG